MKMDLTTALLNLVIGILVGILASLVGLGGGSLFVPILLFLYQLDIHSAVSTSILASLFTAVSSFTFYRKNVKIDYKLGAMLEISTIPGAIVGSYVSSILNRTLLELFFSTILLLSSTKMIHETIQVKKNIRERYWESEDSIKTSRIFLGLTASFLAGFISGSVGISGGSIKLPILILIIGMPERTAIATSTFMIVLTSITALLSHAVFGKINYFIGISMGTGAFLGAKIGGRINLRTSQRKLRGILGIILAIISIRILFDAF